MRNTLIAIALLLAASGALAQPRPSNNARCCVTKVFDASGREFGDVIRWDDRFPTTPLNALVRYRMKGGDVALLAAPESINGLQPPGGGVALFTTPDCSGDTMFAMIAWPPLMKRYAMVLNVGTGGSISVAATNAWLFVSEPLPARVNPGVTFHSQWNESGGCSPIPAPGMTVPPGPFGGFWMKRIEDLYTKFKRPFYSE